MIPYRPHPYPAESPLSFLVRVAFENGHVSILDLVRSAYGVKSNNHLITILSRPNEYRQLMKSLGFTNGYPESITEWSGGYTLQRFEGHNMPNVLYRDDLSAFCPLCLKEEAYWRKLWSLHIYHACTKHGCRLLNSCSHCGSILGTKRSCLYKCANCDFDLRRTKPTTATNEL